MEQLTERLKSVEAEFRVGVEKWKSDEKKMKRERDRLMEKLKEGGEKDNVKDTGRISRLKKRAR